MGLGDLVSGVVFKVRADTKQAIKEFSKLDNAQKKAGKEQLERLKVQEKALDAQHDKWVKIGVGVGAAVAAYKLAQGAFTAFAKDAQLRGATVGVSLGKLRTASKGLATDFELLTFAAAANNAEFKLSQDEMGKVQKFMLVLRKRGFDYNEIQKEVNKTILEGGEGLKKFGVVVKDTSSTLAGHQSLMEQIRIENEKHTGSLAVAGDGMKQFGVDIENTFRDIKVAAGGLVAALIPVLRIIGSILRAPKTLIDTMLGVAGAASSAGDLANMIALKNSGTLGADATKRLDATIKAQRALINSRKDRIAAGVLRGGAGLGAALAGGGALVGTSGLENKNFSSRKQGVGGGTTFALDEGRFADPSDAPRTFTGIDSQIGGLSFGPDSGEFGASGGLGFKRGSGGLDPAVLDEGVRRMAKVRENNLLTSKSFSILSDAASTAFLAMVTGTKSVSAAFREMTAGVIMAMSKDRLAASMVSFGKAAANFSNPAVALGHLGSGAKNLAIAGTLAALSAKIGGAGGGASASAGGAGSAGGFAGATGGAPPPAPSRLTIIAGEGFGADSERKRAARVRRAIRISEQEDGPDSLVRFA